jgi:hypothetical protein
MWRMTSGAKLPPVPQKGRDGKTISPDSPTFRASHNVTADEKEAAAKLATGSDTFELVGVADFVAPSLALNIDTRKALYPVERVNSTGALAPNRRVAAKGVWIPGTPGRVNLTSVVVLSESCGVSSAN